MIAHWSRSMEELRTLEIIPFRFRHHFLEKPSSEILDDLLDAAIAACSARHFPEGKSKGVLEKPPLDKYGLPMQIHF